MNFTSSKEQSKTHSKYPHLSSPLTSIVETEEVEPVKYYSKEYKLSKKLMGQAKRIFKSQKIKELFESHNRNMPKFIAAKFLKFYKEKKNN